ncbi:hydroxyethylthiazole kinase [Gordonibacter massiliensis (ex Traore et al. 2017)]|uniref:Hydroxyethylthiazole kinase n=1 Tax=Gordonibacter massiliensis (ex Traore et al. 2017) TaxID=1841863 RepID=A0A842JFJ4_9ACTN|nr:hydroxyethylthiazole kinase [Gordonibacter massiliensis (ex Traore et al. 2017)]
MEKAELERQVAAAVDVARREVPLVGSVTNAVSVNFVANAQLAAGGSAAMVYLPDEAEFLAQAGGALYLNLGTLLPVHEETMPRGARAMRELGKPWVLDPVGIGIGSLRTGILKELKVCKPAIVRANASEVIALAGLWELDGGDVRARVRGVDSTDEVDAAEGAAVALARWTEGAVAVSGAVDLVTDGTVVATSRGGSPLMEKVTGFGCSLGGVAAVYAAVASPLAAALAATAAYNLAGARAFARAQAPGSFQAAFLDELYEASAADVAGNPFDIREV